MPRLVRVGIHAQPPFTIDTITYKVAVYAPAELAVTLPLFHLYPCACSLRASHWLVNTEYIGVECFFPLGWSKHCNFVCDGNFSERGWVCTPTLTSLG